MSATISTSFGTTPTLLRSIDVLNAQNDALTAETSSGIVADSFAGLGDETSTAIGLQPQISATSAWQANVSDVQTRLSSAQTALSSINTIATNLQSTLLSLTTVNSSSAIATASDNAKQQLTALTSLLNTQSGDIYVFGGSASDQPPVSSSDLASSNLVSNIMTAVAAVGTTGAAATESATLTAALDNTPANSAFSSQLSVSATAASGLVQQVQVGNDDTLAAGVVATQGGAASSQSTGSSIRDLIRSLATVAGLSAADPSSAGFSTLVSDTSRQMQSVTQGLQGLVASAGTLQQNATSQGSMLSNVNDALTSQLNTIMDSDPTTVRTQQVALQNQLTASYTLIADMKTLTLAQYL